MKHKAGTSFCSKVLDKDNYSMLEIKGAGGLRARWDYLAVKSTILGQLTTKLVFWVQMDALDGL